MHDWSTKENVAQAGRRERRIQLAAVVYDEEETRRVFSGLLVDEPLEDGDLDDGIITGADFEMQTIGAQPELGGESRLREVELCGIPRVGSAEEHE